VDAALPQNDAAAWDNCTPAAMDINMYSLLVAAMNMDMVTGWWQQCLTPREHSGRLG
jgi:hypothetical protein